MSKLFLVSVTKKLDHLIICKDTVDEDVMAALEQKDITQEKLIAAVKARLY